MFFLIRCVFWLTVVFSTIFSQEPIRQAPIAQQYSQAQAAQGARIGELAQDWIGAAVSLIERKAVVRCAKTDCLKPSEAAAEHFLAVGPVQRGWAQAQAEAAVPLPPRRPAFAAQKMRRAGLEKSSRAEYVIEHSRRS
jgi:hypothetical protein